MIIIMDVIARQIDKAISQRTSSTYIVDGVSTIDTIIVSLKVFNSNKSETEIIAVALSALESQIEIDTITEEARLVNFEERSHSHNPDKASRFISHIFEEDGVGPVSGCDASEYEKTLSDQGPIHDLRVDVIKLNSNGEFLTRYSAMPVDVNQRSIWRNLSHADQVMPESQSDSRTSNAFLGLTGSVDAEAHIRAAGMILNEIEKSDLDEVSISPFGVGGFLISGPAEQITRASTALSTPSLEGASGISELSQRIARELVCRIPERSTEAYSALASDLTVHPYFEFWSEGGGCDDRSMTDIDTSQIAILTRQLPHVAEHNEGSRFEPIVNLDLCIATDAGNAAHSNERLRIAAFALRYHLRLNAGSIFTTDTGKVNGNCIEIGLIAPQENEERISVFIETFDGSDPDYLARYNSSEAYYFCGKERDAPCGTSTLPVANEGAATRETGWLSLRRSSDQG